MCLVYTGRGLPAASNLKTLLLCIVQLHLDPRDGGVFFLLSTSQFSLKDAPFLFRLTNIEL